MKTSYFLVIISFILTEITVYLWHRFSAHYFETPLIRKSHRTHHQLIDKHINEDFYYILPLVFIAYSIGYYLLAKEIFYPLMFTSLAVLIINWYFHYSYHQENHWLNRYQWYRNKKIIHFEHHNNANKNFGIAFSFIDQIFGSYSFPKK